MTILAQSSIVQADGPSVWGWGVLGDFPWWFTRFRFPASFPFFGWPFSGSPFFFMEISIPPASPPHKRSFPPIFQPSVSTSYFLQCLQREIYAPPPPPPPPLAIYFLYYFLRLRAVTFLPFSVLHVYIFFLVRGTDSVSFFLEMSRFLPIVWFSQDLSRFFKEIGFFLLLLRHFFFKRMEYSV